MFGSKKFEGKYEGNKIQIKSKGKWKNRYKFYKKNLYIIIFFNGFNSSIYKLTYLKKFKFLHNFNYI